jgi:1-acyl-sn-glycerol-3-phosphate acyltransferase
VKHALPLEDPFTRFSAATETMQKNLVTQLFTKAGGVTFRRSFREGGKEVKRTVDFEGVAKVEEAIANGWLLHFPAGTTQKGAPLRPGVAQLLHRTKAIAIPLRVDGFRELLLHKQIPGKVLKKCHLALHPAMDLAAFYAAPYDRESGAAVVEQLAAIIADPA